VERGGGEGQVQRHCVKVGGQSTVFRVRTEEGERNAEISLAFVASLCSNLDAT
jgi:hypothetical protein